MQRSKSITDQLEELIRKAKTLNVKHENIIEEDNNNKKNGTLNNNIEFQILDKRREICLVQKNTIKDLIKLHKEELQLLESALRTIEEEEKRIEEILSKELEIDDFFTRTTSVELIENDNNLQVNKFNEELNTENLKSDYIFKNKLNKNNEYGKDDNYTYDEVESEKSAENESDSSRNDLSLEYSKYYNNSERKLRFLSEDLNMTSIQKSNSNSNSNIRNSIRSKNSIRSTISIPQRFNYIRNKNSSLLKDISIRKILNNSRKPDLEESNLDQKDMIRQLHTIYGTKK